MGNIYVFEQRLKAHAGVEFPYASNILVNGEYPKFEKPNPVPAEATHQEKSDFDNANRNYWRKVDKLEEEKIKIFNFIRKWMSTDSENAVAAALEDDERWEEFEADRDPLYLWHLIERTHKSMATGIEFQDEIEADSALITCKMRSHESPQDFLKRLRAAELARTNAGMEPTAEGKMATLFIRGLDSRWGKLKTECINSMAYPDSLTAAVARAINYAVMDSNGAVVQAAVFKAESKPASGTIKNTVKPKVPKDQASSKKKSPKEEGGNKNSSLKCYLCDEPHLVKDCPSITSARDAVQRDKARSINFNETGLVVGAFVSQIAEAYVMTDEEAASLILLDTEAQESIFSNKDLISDIVDTTSTTEFIGLGGAKIKASKKGLFMDSIPVMYHPNARVNILSFGRVNEIMPEAISWVPHSNRFILSLPDGRTVTFINHRHLYVADTRGGPEVYLTVSRNRQLFTGRENQAADQAKEVQRRLGYQTARTIAGLANNNSMANMGITAHDIVRSEIRDGKAIPVLAGRTRQQKSRSTSKWSEKIPKSLMGIVSTKIALHVDIFFVQKEIFVLSVGTPLKVTIISHIPSRGAKFLKSALEEHINIYAKYGFEVVIVRSDREGGITSLSTQFQGIEFDQPGSGKHEPVAERQIGIVLATMRSIMNGLPFKLPKMFISWCAKYSVYCINHLPSRGSINGVSPRQLLTGRVPDYKVNFPAAFMDYVQATVRSTDHTMDGRTFGALVLLPLGNATGSVKVFNLNTKSICTVDNIVILPIPDEVLGTINNMCNTSMNEVNTSNSDVSGASVATDTIPVEYLDQLRVLAPAESDSTTEGPQQLFLGTPDPEIQEDDADSLQEDTNSEIAQEEPEEAETDQGVQPNALDIAPGHTYNLRGAPPINYATLSGKGRRIYHISARKAFRQTPAKAAEAAIREIGQILEKGGFESVDVSKLSADDRKGIIPSMIFFKDKYTPSGVFDKFKARLVAGGHLQDREVYETKDIAAPTASIEAVFILLNIAALHDMHVITADIGGAYLHANMDKPIYMRLDPITTGIVCALDKKHASYVQSNQQSVVKLKKALYGCVESAKLWYTRLKDFLVSIGLQILKQDPCTFTSIANDLIVIIYVDDLLIMSKKKEKLDEFVMSLREEFGEVTDNRESPLPYLGMEIDLKHKGQAKVTMSGYVDDVLRACDVRGFANTPADDNLFVIRDDAKMLDDQDKEDFHSRVAKLLYLSKRVRPDILLAISFLATRVQSPDEDDWNKLERTLKYLNKTRGFGLCFEPEKEFHLKAFVDASYGTHQDRKSHSGMAVTLGKGVIAVKSTKQKIMSKSSTEAELIAASDMAGYALHLCAYLKELCFPECRLTLYQDNMSTISMLRNGKLSSNRSKHIDIRYYWLVDRVEREELMIEHVSTTCMIADVLTKPMQGKQFVEMRKLLLNWDPESEDT
jgi:hypothetical protein